MAVAPEATAFKKTIMIKTYTEQKASKRIYAAFSIAQSTLEAQPSLKKLLSVLQPQTSEKLVYRTIAGKTSNREGVMVEYKGYIFKKIKPL